MRKITYQLASWPIEDIVVAEILYGGEDVAHVIRKKSKLEITFYPDGEEHLVLDLDSLEEVLLEVRRRLQ